MPRHLPCTVDEILSVARKVTSVFVRNNLQCCLFGSTACFLYGTPRTPHDVDMVVLTASWDQESLKRMLVSADSSFYLVNPKTRFATYKVLWCRVGIHECKVDVLLPGIMNIPDIPQHLIEHIRDLPVMPIVPLLLLKLQGWSDHRSSTKLWERAKESQDISDVNKLLTVVVRRGAKWSVDSKGISFSSALANGERIKQFIVVSPESRALWRIFLAAPDAEEQTDP